MAVSLARTARSFGVSPEGIALLGRAHALAMKPRVAAFDDDHHPLYLHPGRTVLVLLRDVACVDGAVLAAAALAESEDAALRVTDASVRADLGARVADLVRAVPSPGSRSLSEELLGVGESVCLVALAERLDHLRHAHLRDADEAWRRSIHAQAEAVYLPMAERTHPRLAQRYRHWCRTFARRLARS